MTNSKGSICIGRGHTFYRPTQTYSRSCGSPLKEKLVNPRLNLNMMVLNLTHIFSYFFRVFCCFFQTIRGVQQLLMDDCYHLYGQNVQFLFLYKDLSKKLWVPVFFFLVFIQIEKHSLFVRSQETPSCTHCLQSQNYDSWGHRHATLPGTQ